jgi:transcriptional regulator with XRE-family HTH domain
MKQDERIEHALRSIAANIRHYRVKRGWTQERLAELADLEPRYVQTLESGRANPSAAVIVSIASVLAISVGDLFRRRQLTVSKPGRPRVRDRE